MSSSPICYDTDVSEDNTSDLEHVSAESSMPVQVARYSLAIAMIEVGREYETVDASINTSSNPSEFFRADCDYAAAANFFSFRESVKKNSMIHQVIPSVSSFSERMELFPDFRHISVGPNDVIPLVVSDVRPPKKPTYFFVLSLEILPGEFVVL